MPAGWFELSKAKNGQFHFSLKAGNSEIILTSEMYDTLASAKNGKFYFVLKAGNHQIIGNSQMYPDEKGRDNGIASVKTNGPTETIKESV